ncbi:mitochondrial dicarboxylate carrier [Thunnus albacares]|uniref:mitochondrial dicarboxylate carrier n=1 Tax=Thunnus albacares TaxID=8236 RepID=UPI001CF69E30|nr:mitochondrial dicarboxylate carrier [Thunnus albacares]
MVRKTVPQVWCSREGGSMPHGVELSKGGMEDQAASRSEGADGDALESKPKSLLKCDVRKRGCTAILCQPLDVVKMRQMSSKVEHGGVFHCLTETAKLGLTAFYKACVPAAIHLIPHTIFTFMFLRQLRQHFGAVVVTWESVSQESDSLR